MCERQVVSVPLCPTGYTYDELNKQCVLSTVTEATCDDTSPRVLISLLVGCSSIGDPIVDITGMTPANAKCQFENHHFNRQYENLYITNTTLYVGQLLYISSVIGNPSVSSFTGNCILHNSSGTPPIDGIEKVITVASGVITNITLFSTLPIC